MIAETCRTTNLQCVLTNHLLEVLEDKENKIIC